MSEYLTIAEAAADVRSHPWTIWRAVRLGVIPAIRVGTKPGSGHYRILLADWETCKKRWGVKPMTLRDLHDPDVALIDQVIGRRA